MTQAAPNVQIETEALHRGTEPTLIAAPPPEEPILQIVKIVQRRWRVWLFAAPVAFGALLAYNLFNTPQVSTATVSLSIQQPGATSTSALAALTGAGSAKRYVGIIESRLLAAKVAARIGLAAVYPTKSADSVVDMLQKAAAVTEQHNDGLVYINVKLAGPALLARHSSAAQRKIRLACAAAANAYAEELQQYYAETDNDKDSLLLREADQELRSARADFDAASAQLISFAGNAASSRVAPTAANPTPAAGGGSAEESVRGSATGLAALYTSLAQTETEIKAADAAHAVQDRMVAGQLQDLEALPDEDPLLRTARARYNEELTGVRELEIRFGPKHPRVVAAHRQLKIAEDTLRQKMAGIARKRTTEDVRSAATLASLNARRQNLLGQIAEDEARFRQSRQTTARYEQLRNEVMLRLEVLKTVGSEAARLRLMTVSAKNRVQVVDAARTPRSSQPGMSKMALSTFAMVFLGLVAWVGIEYGLRMLRNWRSIYASPGPVQIRVEQA
jgi:uncharacterized protein involved in exopolysaccharide biosynthesis